MWDNAVKNTPKESTDQMGPSHSRLRVPMPKEEYVDLANVVEHGKDLVMESKKRKIGNPEDVAQAQSMLSAGHASFGNPMFDDVGGKLAAVASASSNVFSSAATGQDNIFRQQLEAAKIKKEEEKAAMPTKVFDREIAAGRLLERASQTRDKMKKKIDEANAERAWAMEEMEPADGPSRLEGERAVEGLKGAKDRMEDRYQLMPLLIINEQVGSENIPPGLQDDPLIVAILAIIAADIETMREEVKASTELLMADPLCQGAMEKLGWGSGEFPDEAPSLTDAIVGQAQDTFKDVLSFKVHQENLRGSLRDRLQASKAIPIASDCICRVDPQPWLDMASLRLLAMKSSGDAKVFEVDLATFQDLLNKLISFIKDAAIECRKLIERTDKRCEAAVTAEQRRADAAKKKLETKERKASMKNSATAVQARKDGQIPVLSMNHVAIVEMPAFTDLDDLKKAVDEGNLLPGMPYKVKSHPTLKNLVEHKAVKSVIGVFRIQYPSTQMPRMMVAARPRSTVTSRQSSAGSCWRLHRSLPRRPRLTGTIA